MGSRFDLLFLLRDMIDPDKDKQLALHVCKVHSQYNESGDAVAMNMGFTPFDANFMRMYIRKAKTFEPMIDDGLQKDIADAYVAMRDDEKRGDIDGRKSYTTPRTLLAILRLSQAHARARFSERVEKQDFDEAMRLMKASKESVEVSPTKKGQTKLEVVYDILQDLARRSQHPDGWVEMVHVVSMAGHKALPRDVVEEAIDTWEKLFVITTNPDKTMVKFNVAQA